MKRGLSVQGADSRSSFRIANTLASDYFDRLDVQAFLSKRTLLALAHVI